MWFDLRKDILYPLRRLHGWFSERKTERELRIKYRKQFCEKQRENPKTVYLVLTPEHINMGDHAIASAEARMLKELNIDYVEITGQQLLHLQRYHALNLMNGNPIIINGGGNMGTLWLDCEMLHREIVKENPKSLIFIMPNTIYYEDSPYGLSEYRKTMKIFNRHKNLYFYAREENSFHAMKQAYRNVRLAPDMVLSLNESDREVLRKGCLLCLRSDREKTRTEGQEKVIRAQAAELFQDDVRDTDMIADHDVQISEREEMLERKYSEFSGSELVITDRLHGMIFCAITGTPCIVVDSKSPKVKGCYEWVKGLGYIRFANGPEQIVEEYEKIPKGPHTFNNAHLQPYFDELKGDIINKLGWR